MASSSSELPKPGPKRSRAGCLTCRTRRRKCDEGKPTCQNCISKGFECRYAAAFQILGKNNYTPGVPQSVKYTNLKFVSERDEKINQESNESAVRKSSEPETASTPLSAPVPQPTPTVTEHNRRSSQPIGPSDERYEFALHGLLALGSGITNAIDPQLEFPILPANETTSINESVSVSVPHTQPRSVAFDVDGMTLSEGSPSWNLTHITNSGGVPELSDEQILVLLKHYRYRIAPWLDLIDMKQCFGSEVLQLFKLSAPVRRGVLALADQSLNGPDLNFAFLADQNSHETNENILESALLDSLDMARSVLSDLSSFWMQDGSEDCVHHCFNMLLSEISDGSLAASVFWLMARLRLSVALMAASPVRIPLPASLDPTLCCMKNASEDRICRYAQEAVGRCIDATILSRGDEDRWLQQRYGLNRVELWRKLASGFDDWYRHRPLEFQPVIELYPRDGTYSEDEFPIISFSSGATTLANQLYHTGMLLLLQNKPRFVTLPHSNSPTMSLLWQAQRVCGIAVNNDRWDCWDPSLVASLLVAAKTATHQSQHTVLLRTLTHVQQLTGWNVSRHINCLEREWQQAVDW
ncbi:hypothetical protein CC80DRAFT_549693 [Byssothecium circinans]|uniref:Zn(2)-C6 fungal-type domain-containing protein n=1 Tax=Byssothecium circinans TaxID=147558 RepID=A0A6A5TRR7_9PLEO|nr:hypothetical protein CC80DRAFT_549693 [Byssothecium circinans]